MFHFLAIVEFKRLPPLGKTEKEPARKELPKCELNQHKNVQLFTSEGLHDLFALRPDILWHIDTRDCRCVRIYFFKYAASHSIVDLGICICKNGRVETWPNSVK